MVSGFPESLQSLTSSARGVRSSQTRDWSRRKGTFAESRRSATQGLRMKAAVLYWSKTGNTEKVAGTIKDALEKAGSEVRYACIEEAGDLDYFDFDLIFFGFPSYKWRPPQPVEDFLDAKHRQYKEQGRILAGSPEVRGVSAVVFCTYSGPHTGVREAVPATLRAGQYFEHLGIPVLAEWHVVGEFHGSLEMSTRGRLGDIRGRPSDEDLEKVKLDVARLLAQTSHRRDKAPD